MRIAVVGAPCSGKTSILRSIVGSMICSRVMYVVPETSTQVLSSGVNKFNVGLKDFEKLIMQLQLQKEDMYEQYIRNDVVLTDGALLDPLAYTGKKIYKEILKELDLKKRDLYDRYDAVILIETCATSGLDLYNLESNPVRSESKVEAARLHERYEKIWSKHPRLIRVGVYDDFMDKRNAFILALETLIVNEDISEYERKINVINGA